MGCVNSKGVDENDQIGKSKKGSKKQASKRANDKPQDDNAASAQQPSGAQGAEQRQQQAEHGKGEGSSRAQQQQQQVSEAANNESVEVAQAGGEASLGADGAEPVESDDVKMKSLERVAELKVDKNDGPGATFASLVQAAARAAVDSSAPAPPPPQTSGAAAAVAPQTPTLAPPRTPGAFGDEQEQQGAGEAHAPQVLDLAKRQQPQEPEQQRQQSPQRLNHVDAHSDAEVDDEEEETEEEEEGEDEENLNARRELAGAHQRTDSMGETALQPPSPPAGSTVLEVPGLAPPMWLRFSYLTQRGYYPEAPNKANQDSFCVVPALGGAESDHLFGVFDGHGEHGTPCSQFARDGLVENLLRHPGLHGRPDADMAGDLAAAFHDAFVETNRQLHATPSIDDSMSGSTGIAVLLRNRTLVAANVGDSRAVLAEWHNDQLRALDLSSDQTPFREDECRRVKECGARVLTLDQVEGVKDPAIQCWGGEEDDDGDPPRLWVQNGMYPGTAFTRSIGDSVAERIGVNAEPEVMVVDVDENRHPFFVVASDGVFEFLSSQEVVDMVAQHNDPHAACSAIVAESYRLWLQYETRTDDITIIIVSLHSQEPQQQQQQQQQQLHSQRPDGALVSAPGLRSSMLADMAGFFRRPIEGTDADFSPESTPAEEVEAILTKRTDEEKEQLSRALQHNFLFQMLDEDQFERALQAFKRLDVLAGDIIIQQGEEGNRFFVCEDGEFDVLVATGMDEDPLGMVVHRYVADGGANLPSFGDLALLYGTRREASVRAATPGCVWALERSAFRHVRALSLTTGAAGPPARVLRALRSLPLLAPLSFAQLHRLAAFGKPFSLEQGQTMTLDSDTLYVVYQGELEDGREGQDTVGESEGNKASSSGGDSAVVGSGEGGSELLVARCYGEESFLSVELGEQRSKGGDGPSAEERDGNDSRSESGEEGEGGTSGVDGPGRKRPGEGGDSSGAEEGKRRRQGGGGGAGGGRKQRTMRAVRCGRGGLLQGICISRSQLEGAVGPLPQQAAVDRRLRSLQSKSHLQRQSERQLAALQDIGSAEVEWEDTLSGNEWSELGLVRVPSVGQLLAMRRFNKERVAAAGRSWQVLRERTLLHTLHGNPFVPPVLAPLADSQHVGLLLDCPNLAVPLALVMSDEPLSENAARFVAASLVLALQLLHKDGLVFRGISPGTVMLTMEGMVQLPDLRFAKRLTDGRTYTLCGAPDYVAPEMIAGEGHGQAADWWALGVLIHAMLRGDGEGPFGSRKDSELQLYSRIARRSLADYPKHFSPEVISLIDQLLARNPEDRLGCGAMGAEAVKAHPWFGGMPWDDLAAMRVAAPVELQHAVEELAEQRQHLLEEQKQLEAQQQAQQQAYLAQSSSEGGRAAEGEVGDGGEEATWFEGW